MKKTKITVAITGLNAIDSPGPGVGVIRCIRACKDFDLRIIGLSYESLEPGLYMHNIIDKSYQVPYPVAGSDQLLKRIEYVHNKEHIDIIIPNFDAELHHYIKLTPTFEQLGIKTFLPSLDQLVSIDKLHLHDFGKKKGFNVPKTKIINSKSDIVTLKDDFDYPMVVKGKYYEAYVARSEAEINGYYDKLTAKWGLPIIVQQFVKGTEIDIAGLGDGNSNLMGAIPMRKLYITEKGKGWSGVVLGDKELIKLSEEFVKATHWKGGFELELMRTDDDELYLMEINPRFPAWIYTTAEAGQNLPVALIKMAMGMKVKPFKDYEVGKMFVRYSWDLITDISEFEEISTMGEL